MSLNCSICYQNVRFRMTEKGSFQIVYMHFPDWTKRFFITDGCNILIRALRYVEILSVFVLIRFGLNSLEKFYYSQISSFKGNRNIPIGRII